MSQGFGQGGSRPIMDQTRMSPAAAGNGGGLAHDTGFAVAPPARPCARALEPPAAPELRAEIRRMLAAGPAPQEGDAQLLGLMGLHDAGMGTALRKLPEREGAGGAVLAALVRKYRGAIDPCETARCVAAALIFWPEPVPADERLEEAALRLAEFNLDAAQELATAYTYLGPRFTLQFSVRVALEKYGIPAERFNSANAVPADGLTAAGVSAMLAQDQLELMNEMLRPFEIAIRQKIGTVNPVYSLVEKNSGRAVMPARELIEFLRKRNVFA